MNRKAIGFLLAASVLCTVPMSMVGANAAEQNAPFQIAMSMSEISDVPSDHWAYNAVEYLLDEFQVMDPKTDSMFKGNDLMTRYELAQVFYNVVKRIETNSGKDLRKISNIPATQMVDLDGDKAMVVNAVVNQYGIMQPMPGKRFMGNEPISRYEIAFELYNYFVLIESQNEEPNLSRRDRASELSDLPADHWATKAVKEIVDKYQVMDGYPDNTFGGGRRLTRYETAATVREFVKYVNAYLVPLVVDPTPEPTPVPTPEPTPVPTPEPTPVPKAPFKPVDLRLGGDFKVSQTGDAANPQGFLYGPNAGLDWYFLPAGPTRFGIDLHGDWMFYDPFINPGQFNIGLADGTGTAVLNSRLTAGGGLLWRILGAESAQDVGLTLGAGYDYYQLMGEGNFSYVNHGPRGRLDLEIPVGPWFSLIGRNAFTYFIGQQVGGATPNAANHIQWKNDAFAGINIPAYGFFSFEIGYKDTRYQLEGSNIIAGDQGGQANLRFRF